MLGLATSVRASTLDTDLPLLCAELPEARVVVWDDPSIDWSEFDTVVIRSTWDYHERRERFLTWARDVSAVTSLWNPVELVEWNTDKRYLIELADRGIPIVPTRVAPPGTAPSDVLTGDVVVKPSVGAGSNGIVRVVDDPVAALAHVRALHQRGSTALVQPYLADVDRVGESGIVFLGGELSHAVRKGSILAGPIAWEGGLYAEEHVEPSEATVAERVLAERVVAALPPTAYARIDLLPTAEGPVVLEVEVTEPSLYLHLDPAAPARAAAVFRSLAGWADREPNGSSSRR